MATILVTLGAILVVLTSLTLGFLAGVAYASKTHCGSCDNEEHWTEFKHGRWD